MTAPRLSPTELLAIIQPWVEVAETIHRRVWQLSDATPETDALWIGCGSGRSVLWWAERGGGRVQGVDPDAGAIEQAEAAVRTAGLAAVITLQHADPAALPHREAVFDLVVIRMLQCGDAPGDRVIAQAAEVVRRGGTVIGLLPSWFNAPEDGDADQMAALGIWPRQLVEWKAAFRAAGLVELHVEETAPDGAWLAPGWFGPLRRAWQVARWRGVATVLRPAFRSLRRLARTHRLGLSLVRGTRWPHT